LSRQPVRCTSPPVKEKGARCSHGLPGLEHRRAPRGARRDDLPHRPDATAPSGPDPSSSLTTSP
jgi:hypothetical protein